MLLQKTLLSQIEVVDGATQVRLELCVYNEDIKVSSRWHRTSIDDSVDTAAQMEAVNLHLASMGEAPLGAEDIDDIRLFNDLRKELKAQKASDTRVLGEPLAEAVTKTAVRK